MDEVYLKNTKQNCGIYSYRKYEMQNWRTFHSQESTKNDYSTQKYVENKPVTAVIFQVSILVKLQHQMKRPWSS